jgi:hypothetical protein
MLANHGIHTEQAEWRVHVCVKARKVYVFEPQAALKAVNRRAARDQAGHKTVFTGELLTATGYAIPVEEIDPIYEIEIPRTWLAHDQRANAHIIIQREMDTSAKGRKAEKLVQGMWRKGYFPFIRPPSLQTVLNQREQLLGLDLKAVAPGIQVKCDFDGGRGEGCTGNLFIQVSESNPYHRH